LRCPTLTELPPPAEGKTGWPWTEGSPLVPDAMVDGTSWPRVSIITPSFNQASYLEKTLRSVLLQGYPNLEYIIIDGGSRDGSVDIIREYEPWLTYWVSEPDRGQAHGINKGFRLASGEIVTWLNSDDSYRPGTIAQAVLAIHQHADIVYGKCRLVTPDGDLIAMMDSPGPVTLRRLVMFWQYHWPFPPQPAVFFRRHVLESVGLLDETLHYVMDPELWLRAVDHGLEFQFVDAVWADYIIHSESKTGGGHLPFDREALSVGRRYWHRLDAKDHLVCRLAASRLARGRRHLDKAFDAFAASDWPGVRYWLWRALLNDPSRLRDRGVLSLCIKAWGRHQQVGGGPDLA